MEEHAAKLALAEASHAIHARGWVPATSGNFSARIDSGDIAITSSGRDKGCIDAAQIMVVGPDGTAREDQKPSAETALHLQIYRRDTKVRAVLHTHSATSVWASQRNVGMHTFRDLEILKAFTGIDTHEAEIRVPVFANTQDIDALAEEVENHMIAEGQGVGYLIAGHGVYTWGESIQDAMRHLEALEYLFEYLRLHTSATGENNE